MKLPCWVKVAAFQARFHLSRPVLWTRRAAAQRIPRMPSMTTLVVSADRIVPIVLTRQPAEHAGKASYGPGRLTRRRSFDTGMRAGRAGDWARMPSPLVIAERARERCRRVAGSTWVAQRSPCGYELRSFIGFLRKMPGERRAIGSPHPAEQHVVANPVLTACRLRQWLQR